MAVRFTILPRRPYSLARTAERYTRFPEAVDRFDGRVYRRLLAVGTRTALLSVRQTGTDARAVLEVSLEGPAAATREAREAARRVVEVALGAGSDVAAFYRAHRSDALLGEPIRAFRGLRGAGVPTLWEALVTAVLAQQVNLMFAYDIRRELAETFGRSARIGGERYVAFPDPATLAGLDARRLRRFRLSRTKTRAILGLARAFSSGALSEAEIASLPDEEAIERLTRIHGVGRWTAEIGLLRGLGRTDIFPAGDLGVVKYLAQGLLGRATPSTEREMRRFSQRWSPHRGFALIYGYAELNRRKAARTPGKAAAGAPSRGNGSPRRRARSPGR